MRINGRLHTALGLGPLHKIGQVDRRCLVALGGAYGLLHRHERPRQQHAARQPGLVTEQPGPQARQRMQTLLDKNAEGLFHGACEHQLGVLQTALQVQRVGAPLQGSYAVARPVKLVHMGEGRASRQQIARLYFQVGG